MIGSPIKRSQAIAGAAIVLLFCAAGPVHAVVPEIKVDPTTGNRRAYCRSDFGARGHSGRGRNDPTSGEFLAARAVAPVLIVRSR